MQRFRNLTAGLTTLAALLLVSPVETPSSLEKPPPASCKLSVPMLLQVQPGSTPETWNLQLLGRDTDRQVNVWMWSASEAERRLVWRGPLLAGRERSLTISFAAAGAVWAAVETVDGGESGLRAVATAQRGARQAESKAEAGLLLKNPETGETILQYTGRQEGSR